MDFRGGKILNALSLILFSFVSESADGVVDNFSKPFCDFVLYWIFFQGIFLVHLKNIFYFYFSFHINDEDVGKKITCIIIIIITKLFFFYRMIELYY